VILLDTNTVIYLQKGKLKNPLPPDEYSISIITEIELLSFSGLSKNQAIWLNRFIEDIIVLPLDDSVKTKTIQLRKKHKIKTPDAIISATAIVNNATLLTNDKQLVNITELKSQSLDLK